MFTPPRTAGRPRLALLALVVLRGALVALCVTSPTAVWAQTATAGPASPKLVDNNYAVEIFQGPVIAPVRVTGLAGATTAAAEAVEGVYNNAAAPAVREPFSLKWFDYEPSVGISFPGAYSKTDFNNRGEKGDPSLTDRTDRFLALNLGGLLQFGQFGVTVLADTLNYDVGSAGATGVSLSIARVHASAAYGFFGNQLAIGGGLRIGGVSLNEQTQGGAQVTMVGASPQVGAIVKPNDTPFRFGLTARAPVEATPISGGVVQTDAAGVVRAGSLIVPSRITLPWEIEGGVALQLGPRPLNPSWHNPSDDEAELPDVIGTLRARRRAAQIAELAAMPLTTPRERAAHAARAVEIRREEAAAEEAERALLADRQRRLYELRRARYLNWPRERILLLASVLVIGASDGAVAVEGFIDQRRELVGTHVSVAPRFAVESEVIANLLRLRTGVYIEPSRFVDGTKRQHFTFGSDLRLFSWNVFGILQDTTFRLSTFLDISPRYQSFGFGIGVWH